MMRDWVVLGAMVVMLFALAYCAANGKSAAEAAFTTELVGCVDRAATAHEARICHDDVYAKWGIPIARDAGADAR
jgi:hypothetical protein